MTFRRPTRYSTTYAVSSFTSLPVQGPRLGQKSGKKWTNGCVISTCNILLELHVLLSIPQLSKNQVLVYLAPDSSRFRIDPTPKHILLERWLVEFSPTPQDYHLDQPNTSPPATLEHNQLDAPSRPVLMYKSGIMLVRALFTLLRILPSWQLFKLLHHQSNDNLAIQLLLDSESLIEIIDFGKPHGVAPSYLSNMV